MRIAPRIGVLKGPEGDCPPLPFLEVSSEEGEALVARGIAVEYTGDEPAAEAAEQPEVQAPAETDQASVGGAAGDAAAGEASAEPAAAEPPPPAELTERQHAIAESFDILEAAEMVSAGPRQGRPKVQAIKDATGFDDVTVEEVDTLWAAHRAA